MSDIVVLPERYSKLIEKFPEKVRLEDRSNFKGVISTSDDLIEVMTYINQELHYDFLSSVTAVDDFPEDRMEIIYHLFKSVGGPEIEVKVFTDRETPHVPSLVSIFAGAELQEREVYDLFGIRFDNHPDLRRILMWEGFEGYPLRKDYKVDLGNKDAVTVEEEKSGN